MEECGCSHKRQRLVSQQCQGSCLLPHAASAVGGASCAQCTINASSSPKCKCIEEEDRSPACTGCHAWAMKRGLCKENSTAGNNAFHTRWRKPCSWWVANLPVSRTWEGDNGLLCHPRPLRPNQLVLCTCRHRTADSPRANPLPLPALLIEPHRSLLCMTQLDSFQECEAKQSMVLSPGWQGASAAVP